MLRAHIRRAEDALRASAWQVDARVAERLGDLAWVAGEVDEDPPSAPEEPER